MILIKLTKKDDKIQKVTIKGHAGYAKHGKDIVCSAVSAIAGAALMGLKEFFPQRVEYVSEDGFLTFTVPEAKTAEEEVRIDTVLKTMILGLRDVQEGYGAFVKMEE